MITREPHSPGDESEFAARARVGEAQAEEVRQLLFTVHQDLVEHAETGDTEPLRAARGTVIAALAIVEHAAAARRLDLEELDPAHAGELTRPDPADSQPTAWSLADAWLVVTRDSCVLAVSDRAAAAIGRLRREIVGHRLAEVASVDADDVEARLDEADRRGVATTTLPHVPVPGGLQVAVHRLPDTRELQPAFVVILATDVAP